MKQGKLITIEAGDGSGKATQTKLLCDRLQAEGRRVRRIAFPVYESDSSALVRMYLAGDFGAHADDVSAYAASTFFAVDRYASYRTAWKADYEAGAIILADRYTTSNMVHQAVKIEDAKERDSFLDWLWDFEFAKLGLPVPDRVIFLDMAPDVADRLIEARAKKEHMAKDIHEKDRDYLRRCHAAYCMLAEKYGWQRIACSEGGAPRARAAIHADVYAAVQAVLDSHAAGGRVHQQKRTKEGTL
ncbi:MAG: dTMP kinase [Mitsuokella sp.]